MGGILAVLIWGIGGIILLYLLAIMPRIIGKPDATPFVNRLYAHRGLHDNKGDAPENSLRAFEKAVDANFGIELDIQLTQDKIPVVFHDATLKRMCGKEGRVCEYAYEELRQFVLADSEQGIPKLEEVLKLVGGKVPLIVEFKMEGTDCSLCPIADEILKKYEGAYCIESFNPLCLLWYRRHNKRVMRGQLSQDYAKDKRYNGPLYFLLKYLLFNGWTKPDFIAYDCHASRNLSLKICRYLYGCLTAAWTIKCSEELEIHKKSHDLCIFDNFIPK